MLRGIRIGTRDTTDLIARGGAKVRDITSSIYYNDDRNGVRRIRVTDYKIILVHIGTNDLANGRTAIEVSLDIKELIDVIRQSNRDAVIVVSAILYRPVDDVSTFRKVNVFNAEIKRVTERFRAVLFIRSHTVFKSGDTLLVQLYDTRGLHLNRRGLDRFGAYLRARLAPNCLARDFALARRTVPPSLR